jgi:uncharacterized damage-inducible protein DinB
MDEILRQAFAHNRWANQTLLAACRLLGDEQLGTAGAGAFGSILQTWNHLLASEAGYIPRDTGERPAWTDDEQEVGIDMLDARAVEAGEAWQRVLALELDPARPLLLDSGSYQAELFVPVVQALQHGNVHREQVSAMLTAHGVEPPDIDVWAYAEATGHAGPR